MEICSIRWLQENLLVWRLCFFCRNWCVLINEIPMWVAEHNQRGKNSCNDYNVWCEIIIQIWWWSTWGRSSLLWGDKSINKDIHNVQFTIKSSDASLRFLALIELFSWILRSIRSCHRFSPEFLMSLLCCTTHSSILVQAWELCCSTAMPLRAVLVWLMQLLCSPRPNSCSVPGAKLCCISPVPAERVRTSTSHLHCCTSLLYSWGLRVLPNCNNPLLLCTALIFAKCFPCCRVSLYD